MIRNSYDKIMTKIKSIEPWLNACNTVTNALMKTVTKSEVPGINFTGIPIK